MHYEAPESVRAVLVASDRARLVLDIGENLHDSGFDLDTLSGHSHDGRFALAFSGQIAKHGGKALLKRLHIATRGQILATIDGQPVWPGHTFGQRVREMMGSSADCLLALGQPKPTDWAQVASTLASTCMPITTVLEVRETDVEGEFHERPWGAAVLQLPMEADAKHLSRELQEAFRGHTRSVQLPAATVMPSRQIRSKATVTYIADDVQGGFFELLHGVQTSRAFVVSVRAGKRALAYQDTKEFETTFEVLVAGARHQRELEALFALRKGLAYEVECRFGWKSDQARNKAA